MGEPDRRLGRRVPAADDTDARGAAPLGLLWAGGIEDADAFVRLDLRDRKPAVLGPGRENDGAGAHLLSVVEPDEMMVGAGSSAMARYGVAMRAPNFRAWLMARDVNSDPLMPAGKPR